MKNMESISMEFSGNGASSKGLAVQPDWYQVREEHTASVRMCAGTL